MDISKFIGLLFCLQLFYWLIGRYSSKNVQGKEDYFLAGKGVKLFPLMMTFLATQVGGGIVLGAADEAYRYGWPVLFYPLGAALGLILLGAGFGRRLAQFKVSTVAEIFEVVYGSPILRVTASLFSIISLFMILVAQIIASNKFLICLGFNYPPLFILFWGVVIVYTAQGGLKAVISTDIAQAAFFSAVFLFAFLLVIVADSALISLPIPRLSDCTPVTSKLFGWLFMPLLFMLIEQDMGQRCFAGATPQIVSKASLFAGIGTLIVCIVPVFFGTLAKSMGFEVPEGGSVLMAAITQTTNPWMSAIVGCAVLAAIISTATSLINAISSNLSSDFKLKIFDSSNALRFMKGTTCMISIAAIFFSFYFDNIVDLLIQSYELSVSALFAAIFLALFKRKGHFLAALFSVLAGFFGFFLFRAYPMPLPKEILSILLSFCGYGCGNVIASYRLKKHA